MNTLRLFVIGIFLTATISPILGQGLTAETKFRPVNQAIPNQYIIVLKVTADGSRGASSRVARPE